MIYKNKFGITCPHNITLESVGIPGTKREYVCIGTWVCKDRCIHNVSCTSHGDFVICKYPSPEDYNIVDISRVF